MTPAPVISDAVIQQFAPEVRLHPSEKYMPSAVEWYLAGVSMYFNAAPSVRITPSVTVANLTTQSYTATDPGPPPSSENYTSGASKLTGFYLSANNSSLYGGNLSGAVCYAHVLAVPSQPSHLDIQYMFFFPYNGDIFLLSIFGSHEGDWEHVTVRIDTSSNTIFAIYFSSHDSEGKWWNQPSTSSSSQDGYQLNSGHPVVYCALSSHASYPWAGTFKRLFGTANDITADGGSVWQTWTNVVNVGTTDTPLNGQTWITYSGRWGSLGSGFSFSGPLTPSYQQWWVGDPVNAAGYIQMLTVVVTTGTGWVDFLDGAGTNGTVRFGIGKTNYSPWHAWDLDNWSDNFESGNVDSFEFQPENMLMTDLQQFTIFFDGYATLANDKWLLAGLTIYADGITVYENPNVNRSFTEVDRWTVAIRQGSNSANSNEP
ncbi:MAG TPA: Vps62-related protein [Thermoanaerobaculia bacterium]|nr:Vps62-related protein [Thermoanaerobaculia bacterium]